ncbi:MAG: DUF4301 family protein [Bacteroidota bacterium]|nr:DUF4301 family protein [Bacteroidota bacterium]
MNFSQEDIQQIKAQGISLAEIEEQIDNFVKGFEFMNLDRPATIGDGIKTFSDREIDDFATYYKSGKLNLKVMKFVPSSGAATRMMKDLYTFVNEYKDESLTPLTSFPSAEKVITHIEDFAFYSLLKEKMKNNDIDLEKTLEKQDYKTIIEFILLEKGLNYGKSPKAWILFHKQGKQALTPFEEHLLEAAHYCACKETAKIEFSILEEHREGFEQLKKELVPKYEELFNIKYDISFSYQQHSTDTIAVDMDNNPIHTKDRKLLFRPAGHGALIENINKLSADIIFIKNIDNVCSKYREETYKYKEFLGGVLLFLQKEIFSLQEQLSKKEIVKQDLILIYKTLKNKLGFLEVKSIEDFKTTKQYQAYLSKFLDRPLRVCGMVKNEGEVGGGPFFVRKDNKVSLQIVEKAQVNLNNQEQKEIFEKATHFNPVDLVVSFRKADGKKYNLLSYIDKQAGFISEKSFEGQNIKAQERPGLWNGAMSDWITIFVEVPLTTFNPVKTITDLLKDPHL